MPHTREEILDLPAPKRQSAWQLRLFYTAVVAFTYYFTASWMGWPGFAPALLAGLLCFAAIAVMRFRKNRKSGRYQYAYLSGHLSLLPGIGLYLLGWPHASWLFWLSFASFGTGLLLLRRQAESTTQKN